MIDLVITRHLSLIELLEKRGIITPNTPRIDHVDNIDTIKGLNVCGVVPPKLAIHTNSILEIPMNIPFEWREKSKQLGFEIPLEELEKMAGEPAIYKVEKVEPARSDFSEAVVITFAATFLQYIVREGLIARRGPQHIAASNRMQKASEGLEQPGMLEEFKGKPVIGHLSLNMAQHALDVTTVDLRYVYERRGQVHDYEEMKSYDHGLLTYRVKHVII